MDVGLNIFGWLDLDYEIHIRNIKSSRRHICRHKYAELVIFEPRECNLSLALCDVTMHNFNVFGDFIREDKCVGLRLRGGEDNGLT